MEKFIDDSKIHQGHRSRMLSKLSSYGQRIFDTYELLEMLLYRVIPYKDTNPIAKNLLYAFGDLDGVFSATKEELLKVNGIGERSADFLLSVGYLSEIIGSELSAPEGILLSDFETVGKYFLDYFSSVDQKQVAAIFLDSSMRLIETKKMYDLEYESGGVKAKPFIDTAMKNHAAVVISAHNHPYGPFYPTQGDRATNTAITEAMNLAGIVHAEHYIICGEHFAGIGSLKSFSMKLSQMPAVSEFLNTRDKYADNLNEQKAASRTNENLALSSEAIPNLAYFSHILSYCAEVDPALKAEALFKKYRTVENIFTASCRELSIIVDEKTALYIKLLAFVTARRRTDKLVFGKAHNSAEIAEYFKAMFLGESVEKIYIISLDSRDRVVSCDLLGEGTVNASEILPRKAIEAATEASAASVIIAHNHPFGNTNASSDDVNLTKALSTLFTSCGIELKEHFIIAGQLCDTVIF